ncbi:MAG: hypothetical protein WC004_03680 [Candidatus Absconditabacterales bacterium]
MAISLNVAGTKYNLQKLQDQLHSFYKQHNIIDNAGADRRFQNLLKRIKEKTPKVSFDTFFETYCLDIEILHKENIHNFLIDGYLVVLYETGDIKFVEYKKKEDNANGARYQGMISRSNEEDVMSFDDGQGLFDQDDNYVAPIPSLTQYFDCKFVPRDIEFVVNGKKMSIAAFQKYLMQILDNDTERIGVFTRQKKEKTEIAQNMISVSKGCIITLQEKVHKDHKDEDQFVVLEVRGSDITVKHGNSSQEYSTAVQNIKSIKLDTTKK